MSHGVTAVALSAGQRSVGCSSDRVFMPSGLLLIAIASPLPNPRQAHISPGVQSPDSSHMAANQRFGKLCLRDRDGIGTQMYGSGTVAGPVLVGAGRAWESCLRERAGAGWHNLSRATLYSVV